MTRAISRIVVHATWSTGQRAPVVTEAIEAVLEPVLRTQCIRLGARLIALGAAMDHVHVVCTLPATTSLSAMMKALKGASGAVLLQQTEGLVAWSRGYFAESAWPEDLETLVRYVRDQRLHHHARSTVAAWEPR